MCFLCTGDEYDCGKEMMAVFTHTIDALLERNLAFACWFTPQSDIPYLALNSSSDIKQFSSVARLSGEKGFVFAPFEVSASSPVVLLEPDAVLRGFEEICAINIDERPASVSTEECQKKGNIIVGRKEYTDCINGAIEAINSGKFSKVVFSRCTSRKRQGESLGKLFLTLQQRAPGVFVYLVNIPHIGLWIGATPETLLAVDGDFARTVSLAGTQPLRSDGKYCWFAKEIEEQAFVSRYAVDILNRYGVSNYTTKGPENLETTAVAHLKTTFTFPAKNIMSRLGSFVADLSPTPAVCGLPKESARKFILSSEPHSRKYYAGFLGPWNLEHCSTHLFVNLRCMEVNKEEYLLYTGGGITAKSSPDAEWDETNHKAQTLLAVIDSLQGA